MGAPLDHLRSACGEVMPEQPVPHSPLPWAVDYSLPLSSAIGSIESGDGWSVATIWNDIYELPARENAEFICRACNSHAALVAALKETTEALAVMHQRYDPDYGPREAFLVRLRNLLATAEATDHV